MAQAPLHVRLSEVEDQQLFELRDALQVPKRTRQRAEMLRLSHRGWKTAEIAEYQGCRAEMVREAIHRWEASGIAGLYDQPRSGRPPRWQEADWVYVEAQLSEEGKTFNSRQVSELLTTERQVKLSRRQTRRLLKKRGTAGSAPAPVTKTSKTATKKRSSNLS
ncbi:MAG: helix-turn-helix domain-containing protein [Cyanobacteria bacterium J06554_6]